jgi:hypothetical protein
VDVAKLLTNQISIAPTLEQLHRLAVDNQGRLGAIHAASLLMRAAQLSAPPLPDAQPAPTSQAPAAAARQHQLVDALVRMAERHVGDFDGARTSCALYALAKLNQRDAALLGALTARAAAERGSSTPLQLRTCLWALAKLDWRPGKEWVCDHLAACQAHMGAGAMTSLDLSLLMSGLAMLGARPSDQVREPALH